MVVFIDLNRREMHAQMNLNFLSISFSHFNKSKGTKS